MSGLLRYISLSLIYKIAKLLKLLLLKLKLLISIALQERFSK